MTDERRDWLRFAERLTAPVVENLSARRLRAAMPVESAPGAVNR